MTLITGLLTRTGVILAADSAASVSQLARLPVEKLGQLSDGDNSAWYGGAGPTTRIQDLRLYFAQHVAQFQQSRRPKTLAQLSNLEVREGLRQSALKVLADIQQAWERQPGGAAQMNPQSECASMLVAVPGPEGYRLFGVDVSNAATAQATLDNPLMAIGSGSVGAIPFYSFLRRAVYPRDELQDMENALLAVCWVQYQVISTTPGGVAEPIHIVCLCRDGQTEVLAEDRINELKSRVSSIEEALQEQALHPAAGAPLPPPIPAPTATPDEEAARPA